jgi:TfoX/Sxy family transcriptional regulator of competence genes
VAYNETLADRIRLSFDNVPKVQEKKMMGGLTFMVNGKMCVGVMKDDLMVRISPNVYEESLEKPGCRQMKFTGKPLKGFVFVDDEGTKTKKSLDYWLSLALDFNKIAKASKPKKKSPQEKNNQTHSKIKTLIYFQGFNWIN